MPVRYYPSSKVIKNQNAESGRILTVDGRYYTGKYYLTYDGKAFSGPSPEIGPNEPLIIEPEIVNSPIYQSSTVSPKEKLATVSKNPYLSRVQGKPTTYYPQPTASDYKRGYVIRYFTKKENEPGFVTEISEDEYNSIVNGTANYDTRFYQTEKILWKLTGPLNSERRSQYNTIPGIIDTNKRLTESASRTFLGLVEYIGGDYAKYSRPTA